MLIDIQVPPGWNSTQVLSLLRQNTGLKMKHAGCSNLEDVVMFNEKFEVPVATVPSLLNEDNFTYRIKFLLEELDELVLDHTRDDLKGALDALIDLVYVALGTAHMMGLAPYWQEGWNKVQTANMAKIAAPSAEDSKRGSAIDVIKPAGWLAPDHSHIGNGPWPTY